MIICQCNRLTDHAVRDALDGQCPPLRVSDVYSCLGCKPTCGACARTIKSLISESYQRCLICPEPCADAHRYRSGARELTHFEPAPCSGECGSAACAEHRLSEPV